MFCNFLNVVLIFGLIAWKARWLNARISVILVAAIVMCSIFTISSGLGAVVLCVGVWFWYCQRKSTIGRVVLTAGIAICLISLLASFVALQAHETAPYAFNVVTFIFYPSPRLLVWSEAWHRFIDNFWLGNGPGSPSAEVIFQNSEGGNSLLTDAHNSFLSVATQTGVFGLAAFLAVSFYILRIGCTEVAKNLTRFGLLIAFVSAFMLQGMTGSFEDARHLWFLVGTIIAARRNLSQEESTAEI
jgi:O-antigen ligase